MTIINALILGIIQGLTEFIPVSSSAHLLLAQVAMGVAGVNSTAASNAVFAFTVLVQLGTTLALIVYFWRDLIALIRAFFAKPFSTPENRLAWYIIIATVPALIAGFLLKDAVKALFRTPLLEAAIRLLVAAVLLFLAERFGRRSRNLDTMGWFDSLVVGLFQVLAVFPGVSRSGATISGGMLREFDRPSAARFAFLISVPVLLAAGAYESFDLLRSTVLPAGFVQSLLAGLVVAAVVGWLSIRWLLNYLNRHSLYVFAGYCAIVGLIALVIQYA